MKWSLRSLRWRRVQLAAARLTPDGRLAANVRRARLLMIVLALLGLLVLLMVALNGFVQFERERLGEPVVPREAVPRLKREDLTHFTRQFEKFRQIPVPSPTSVPSPTPSAQRRSRRTPPPVLLP